MKEEYRGPSMVETSNAGSRFEDLGSRIGQRFAESLPRFEQEFKRALSYFNDQVVPQLRKDSSRGLRAAAGQFRQWADHLDDSHKGGDR
jgi:hypothetical protein